MRTKLSLNVVIIILAIIGLVPALIVPDILSGRKKDDLTKQLEESLRRLSAIASSSEQSISQSDIPEGEKELILDHIKNAIEEVRTTPPPDSKVDIETQIASVEFLSGEIGKPDALIVKASSKELDPTVSPLQTAEGRLIRLEARIEALPKERLDEWDVAKVVFLILGALAVISALFKYSSQQPLEQHETKRKKGQVK